MLQIAVSVVFFDRHWSKMTERLAYAVTGEMIAAANLVEEAPKDLERFNKISDIVKKTFDLEMHLFSHSQHRNAHILDRTNKLLPNPFDRIEKDLTRQLNKRSDFKFNIVNLSSEKRVIVDLVLSEGIVEFKIPERRLFSASSYIFILWMIGLSVLLFTVAMLFMRNQIRPIYRLSLIAERLGRGVPVGKIKPSGAQEVRQAAEAFINMQERINQFIDQRTTMLAAVSHDLKTPLTRMKLQLEMIDNNEDKEAMRTDIKDMEQMIEGYLSFTKGDGGEEIQRISLADLFLQIKNDAKRLDLEVQTSEEPPNSVFILAKPQALKRVFDNILGNTHRYGTKIYLSCSLIEEELKNYVQFSIEDNGEGVAETQINDLIKPFFRGDSSRNKKTGGVGLGLAIAHDIIAAHGGKLIFSKSKRFGGLQVIINLPL